jgi:hypothetical protein
LRRCSGRGCALAAPRYSCLRLRSAALGALIFKLVDRLQQAGHMTGLVFRPSETIETYLYFFILAYLIVFARRIKELEVAEGVLRK